jgi:hypothetical protein
MILSIGSSLPGAASAAETPPCYTQYLPCPPPPQDNYVFPGMVLPVRAGTTIPGGQYEVSPGDAKCVATLSAFGAAVALSRGAAVAALRVPPVGIMVTNKLADACAGTVLKAL